MSHLRTQPATSRIKDRTVRSAPFQVNDDRFGSYQDLRQHAFPSRNEADEAFQQTFTAVTERDISEHDQERYPTSQPEQNNDYPRPMQRSLRIAIQHREANSDAVEGVQRTEPAVYDLRPIVPPKGYPEINWLPLFLRPWVNITCLAVYAASMAGLFILLFGTDDKNQFYTESENLFLAFRYGPSVLGTITSLLFRTTGREFYRICRYAVMADSRKGVRTHALARRGVLARYFPVNMVPNVFNSRVTSCVWIAQLLSSLVVASKASLFTLQRSGAGWTITSHLVPAWYLVVSHFIMLACTVLIILWLRKHPSGLMWDPAALADQVALFTQCDAIQDAAFPDSGLKSATNASTCYRLGYWVKSTNDNDSSIVYGIGSLSSVTGHGRSSSTSQMERGQSHPASGRDHEAGAGAGANSEPEEPVGPNSSQPHICECLDQTDHYPYRKMPFVGHIEIVVWSLLVPISLGLLVFSVCLGHYNNGFSVKNNILDVIPHISRSTGNSTGHSFNGTSTFANQTIKNDDHIYNLDKIGWSKQTNIWMWAFLFRSLPTVFASAFAGGFLFTLDCNHRFVQPFLAMRQPNGGTPDETVLCTYNTDSSLELPGKAIAAGHYKVAWHSILFGVSPLFPICVASLYTIVNTGDRVYFTYSPFSLNTAIAYLVVYTATLAMPWPSPYRLMPQENYNLMETVALCHASTFAASDEMLNNNCPNATQSYMYDRIRLRAKNIQDRYVYGQYLGTDGNLHMGFDIAEKGGQLTGKVEHVPVEESRKRWFGPLRRRKRRHWGEKPITSIQIQDERNVEFEMPEWEETRSVQTGRAGRTMPQHSAEYSGR